MPFDLATANRAAQAMATRADELAVRLTTALPGCAYARTATSLADYATEAAAHVAAMDEQVHELVAVPTFDYDEVAACEEEAQVYYRRVEMAMAAIVSVCQMAGPDLSFEIGGEEASAVYWEEGTQLAD